MLQQKHILILHPHFTLSGGAGKFALEVGQRLAKRDYKVSVINMKSKDKLTLSFPNIRVIDVKGPLTSSFLFWLLFPYWYWKVSKMIDMLKPDVLFPQVFPAQWWALLYKHFHPHMRTVWMCQEPSAFIHSETWIKAIHSPLKRFIASMIKNLLAPIDIWLANKADAVIANSKFSLEMIQHIYGIDESKLSVAYPGVSDAFLVQKPETSREHTVVTVSRLSKFKNIDFLIKTFVKFAEQRKEAWHLHVVGDGEEKKSLERLVSSLNAQSFIHLAGQLSDQKLSGLLRASTFYLSAAVDEPFGISLVEAQASGAIVIAHNSGGPKETIINDKTGKLVDHLDSELYVQAMNESLIKNLAVKLSKNAHSHSESFNWNSTTNKVNKVLFPSDKESPPFVFN